MGYLVPTTRFRNSMADMDPLVSACVHLIIMLNGSTKVCPLIYLLTSCKLHTFHNRDNKRVPRRH